MTMMLVSRALERIGDNAVDIGEQVGFVVRCLFCEFSDAPHPGRQSAAVCGDGLVTWNQRVMRGWNKATAAPEPTILRCTMASTTGQSPVRLGVLDSDTGFLQVLANRLDAAGWQHRVLASPVPIDALVSMRLNVLVIDLAVLGPAGWSYLEKVCERLPALGVIVCTGRSSVSQRVRGLRLGADDWITKPCHPEELI